MENRQPGYMFVYGTLKRKGRLHDNMEGAKFAAEGTLKDYGMYHVSWFPGIKPSPGDEVHGELYAIPNQDEFIRRIDWIEGAPSLYSRKVVTVKTSDPAFEGEVEAYTYVYNGKVSTVQFISNGRWEV